jgi:tetratricopeptide (TPR) repeat protein
MWVAYLAASGIFWVGYGFMRVGLIRVARTLFFFAHGLSPRHFLALRFSAWCFRETGDLSGAIEYYRKLLKLYPSFIEGFVELGFAYSRLERYPEALEQFQAALDESPRDLAARRGLAAMLICLNHSGDAIRPCEELVRDDPTDSVAWGFLGRARADRGQWDDALAAYERAQEHRSDPQVAAEQAAVLMEVGRYIEAEAVLKTALATHAGDRTLRVELASAMMEQERHAEAQDVLREILREDPVNAHARQVLGSLFAITARAPEAAAVTETLVNDFPDDPTTHALLGLVARKAGRWHDALAAFENALLMDARHSSLPLAKVTFHAVTAERAMALTRLGRQSEAEPLVTTILERDPRFFERHSEYAELVTLTEASSRPRSERRERSHVPWRA